ncbi:MAG: hypothetical protein ABSB38_03695 [Dehalococcoidia bacterium]
MSTAFRLVPITAKDKVSLSWFSLEFYLINWLLDNGYANEVSSVSQLEQGDVIYYAWSSNAYDDHVAVYLGGGNVAAHTNCVNDAPWQLGGAYKYRFIHMLHN